MSLAAPDPRERKLIALLILVALVALVWLAIVVPVLNGFADRAARREDLRQRYRRDQIVAAALPRLRGDAARLRARSGAYAVVAPDRTAAVQALQEHVARLLDRNNAVTKSVQEVSARAGWVGVRADAALSLAQLTALLEQLGNARPLVVVETVTIAADEAFRTGHLDTMDIRLEIAAPIVVAAVR